MNYIHDKNITIKKDTPDYYEESKGNGIIAKFKENTFIIGHLRFIEKSGTKIREDTKNDILAEENNGYNVTIISINNECKGFFVLADEIKINIKDSIAELKKIGVERIIMLSGDNEKV